MRNTISAWGSSAMKKFWRGAAAAAMAAICIAVLTWTGSHANMNDFVEYWSAGQLLAHGANPYSGPLILALEKSRGFAPADPLIMLNPPWALPLVAPLGYLPAVGALVLWIVACAGCLFASMVLLEIPSKNRAIAFLFAPVLGSFMMQQSSPFLLLGLSIFLRFHRSRPFWAGAALVLMALKPHLFLIFWVVLMAESIYRRNFVVLTGFAASLITVSGLVTLARPHVWLDYLDLLHQSTLDRNFYPTLPSILRMAIDVKLVWIAAIPSGIAVVWGLAYYWRRRAVWDWRRHGMPVLLATMLTSPYSWVADQVILLPPVAWALANRPRRYSLEVLLALNCLALVGLSVSFRSLAGFPLAILLWFLYANATEKKHSAENPVENAAKAPAVPSL